MAFLPMPLEPFPINWKDVRNAKDKKISIHNLSVPCLNTVSITKTLNYPAAPLCTSVFF